jgi:hypothetical protein
MDNDYHCDAIPRAAFNQSLESRKMAIRAISSDTYHRITVAYRADMGAADKLNTAIEALAADGFKQASDFISPKSKGSSSSPEEWAQLKTAVKDGMLKADQAIMSAPTKSLSAEKKARKTYLIQQVASFIGKIKRKLEDKEKGPKAKKAFEVRLREQLNAAIKSLEDSEAASFDVTKCVTLLKEALDMVK